MNRIVFKITYFLLYPVCSCEHLLQRRVPGGGDQRAAVSQAVQAAAADLLWSRPCKHAALVLRPGTEQAGRTGGAEVGNEGGLHLQRDQRGLLRRGREVAAAVENPDGISSQPRNGFWLSKPPSDFLQHKPWKWNEASTKVFGIFCSRTTITCRVATLPSQVVVRQDQPGHPRMRRQKNFFGQNSEQRREKSLWIRQESDGGALRGVLSQQSVSRSKDGLRSQRDITLNAGSIFRSLRFRYSPKLLYSSFIQKSSLVCTEKSVW